MSEIKHKTVLITGGAAGIGKIMGRMALEKGATQLIMWDIDAMAMEKTREELSNLGSVKGLCVDVSKLDDIQAASAQLKSEGITVDILINNAGIVVGTEFWRNSHSDITRTMSINTNALMHITLELLPGMMERNQGHIVNISSAVSLVANPKMAVYAASKWAVTAWSESLRLELEQQQSAVKVTTVTPSYISTGMFDGVKTHWIQPIVRPESAAKQIIQGIERNRIFVRMPWSVYLTPFLKGILPVRWFDLLVGKGLKVYKSMDDFKGH